MFDDLSPPRKKSWPLVLTVVILAAVGGGIVYLTNRISNAPPAAVAAADTATQTVWRFSPPESTPFHWPGIKKPPTQPADTPLADETPVIGVSAGGKHRAYRVGAFKSTQTHIVDDVLGGVAITVTHCDRTGCTKVFTGDGSEPLPIDLGGIDRGKLLLQVKRSFYEQDSGKNTAPNAPDFMYWQYSFVQTTWKAWKEEHPDTDIYLAAPSGPMRP